MTMEHSAQCCVRPREHKIIVTNKTPDSQPIYIGQIELEWVDQFICLGSIISEEPLREKWSEYKCMEVWFSWAEYQVAVILLCGRGNSHVCQWNMEKHEQDIEEGGPVSPKEFMKGWSYLEG